MIWRNTLMIEILDSLSKCIDFFTSNNAIIDIKNYIYTTSKK